MRDVDVIAHALRVGPDIYRDVLAGAELGRGQREWFRRWCCLTEKEAWMDGAKVMVAARRPAGTASAWDERGGGRWVRHGGWPGPTESGHAAEGTAAEAWWDVPEGGVKVWVRDRSGRFMPDVLVRGSLDEAKVFVDAALAGLGWSLDDRGSRGSGAPTVRESVMAKLAEARRELAAAYPRSTEAYLSSGMVDALNEVLGLAEWPELDKTLGFSRLKDLQSPNRTRSRRNASRRFVTGGSALLALLAEPSAVGREAGLGSEFVVPLLNAKISLRNALRRLVRAHDGSVESVAGSLGVSPSALRAETAEIGLVLPADARATLADEEEG